MNMLTMPYSITWREPSCEMGNKLIPEDSLGADAKVGFAAALEAPGRCCAGRMRVTCSRGCPLLMNCSCTESPSLAARRFSTVDQPYTAM